MADEPQGAARFRRPWYWLIVLVVAAILSTLLSVGNASTRVAQNERQFRTAQELRLHGLKHSIDDLFDDCVQLVSSGAKIFARLPAQQPLISRLARELYASAINPRIYGTGAFFVRGSMGGRSLMSVYVRRFDASVPRSAQDVRFGKSVEVDYRSANPRPGDDYTRARWFRVAMSARGRIVFFGPYRDQGRSFISVLRAFDRNGRPAGVMSVDVLASEFMSMMQRRVAPGDVASIVRGGRDRLTLISSGAARATSSERIVTSGGFLYTPMTHMELRSDATALQSADRNIWLGTALIVLAIWAIAAMVAVGVVQRWSATEREVALGLEQVRLERQIAISQTVENELRRAAYTDSLTGLPNRAAFLERAREVIDAAPGSYAVLFIDLDRFNRVNETLGHLSGDELLRSTGVRIGSLLGPNDMVARLGGDEFVVLKDLSDQSVPALLGETLLAHLGDPIVIQGRSIYPEASIGIVVLDGTYRSADEMLRDADIAMYEAKRRGRAQFVMFDAQMRMRVARDAELEAALRRALERGELVPYYQPVVSFASGAIEGFEALARWQRGDELVMARDFMPFAESHGLAAAIDVHMMREVFRHSRAIYDCFPGAKLAINISASELEAAGLVQTIERLRERDNRAGDRLELEITETTMMSNSEAAKRTVERLRELGIDFVLDDFGTGYSSLSYLQRLPITGIKIDRVFVAPLPHDRKAVEIVRSIVLLARSMDLRVTAEGVETVEQFDLLRELEVDYAQGFFFSAAIDMAAVMQLQDRTISSRFAVE